MRVENKPSIKTASNSSSVNNVNVFSNIFEKTKASDRLIGEKMKMDGRTMGALATIKDIWVMGDILGLIQGRATVGSAILWHEDPKGYSEAYK